MNEWTNERTSEQTNEKCNVTKSQWYFITDYWHFSFPKYGWQNTNLVERNTQTHIYLYIIHVCVCVCVCVCVFLSRSLYVYKLKCYICISKLHHWEWMKYIFYSLFYYCIACCFIFLLFYKKNYVHISKVHIAVWHFLRLVSLIL